MQALCLLRLATTRVAATEKFGISYSGKPLALAVCELKKAKQRPSVSTHATP
jgi:hypothetical protein